MFIVFFSLHFNLKSLIHFDIKKHDALKTMDDYNLTFTEGEKYCFKKIIKYFDKIMKLKSGLPKDFYSRSISDKD